MLDKRLFFGECFRNKTQLQTFGHASPSQREFLLSSCPRASLTASGPVFCNLTYPLETQKTIPIVFGITNSFKKNVPTKINDCSEFFGSSGPHSATESATQTLQNIQTLNLCIQEQTTAINKDLIAVFATARFALSISVKCW